MSLYTALHTKHRLAGVVGLSCWYPLHKQIGDVTEANKETPFLQVEREHLEEKGKYLDTV